MSRFVCFVSASASDMTGMADRGIEVADNGDEENNEAGNQHEAEGMLEVEAPEVGDGLNVAIDAVPEALALQLHTLLLAQSERC